MSLLYQDNFEKDLYNQILNDDNTYKVINQAKKNIYYLLWARNIPKKDILNYYIEYSKRNGLNLTVLIDDITPQYIYQRTPSNQEYITNQYQGFLDPLNIKSEILSQNNNFVNDINTQNFINLLNYTNLNHLKYILPLKKRNNIIQFDDLIHYFIQLSILENINNNNIGFIIGKISAGLYYLFNDNFGKINFIILNNK